jgi:hypothetical protein
MQREDSNNPIIHVRNIRQQFKEQVEHLRTDIKKVNEPQCKAMFETAAEVLIGLIKAFEDYERKEETAWNKE